MHLHANHLVILLVNDLANRSRSEVACGANIAARWLGYRLVCLDWHGEHQWEQEYLATILSTRPCGVLFLCPFETQNLPLCQKVAASVPTVQVLLPHPEISSDIVAIDNYAGASLAMEHLVELGYRRIGHITFSFELPPVQERLKAYLDALKQADLPYLDGHVSNF